MSKTILLARPHPFIVAEMRPLLEQSGYTISKLEKLADLTTLARGASGAVISLALASPIPESVEEVFMKLQHIAPNLPVLFASLLDLNVVSRNIEEIGRKAGIHPTILGVVPGSDNSPALGKHETFLYIGKNDMAVPERRALAARLIQRHFG
jgi:hypothetical protein